MPQGVPDILEAGAETFRERNAVYGDTYKNFGPALLAVFGGEVPAIVTENAAARMGLVVQCLGKLTRYCAQFEHGGHVDSAHDLCVYAAMLEEMTNEKPRKV